MDANNAQRSRQIIETSSAHNHVAWTAGRLRIEEKSTDTDRNISLIDHPNNMNHVVSEFSFVNYVRNHFSKHDFKLKKRKKVVLKSLQKSGPDIALSSSSSPDEPQNLEKSEFFSASDSMVQLRGGILRNYQNIVRRKDSFSSSSSSSTSTSSSTSDSSSRLDSSNTNDEYSSSTTRRDGSSSDSSSESESELSPPEPPDGGWGWIIVFATFFIQMIDDGVAVSFGIFLDDLAEEFGTSLSVTSWVGAFGYGIPCLAAPLASMLINRFQCRRVCVIGGLISAIGCALAFFVESMLGLVFTFGILVGLGASLSSTAALIIVSLYFDDRRATATGLSIAGSGVGSFVFAPLVNYLISVYTWRGAMLVLSGIFTHIVVFGCLMRPVETGRQRRKRQLLLRMENFAKESGFKLPEVYLKSEEDSIDRRIHLLRKLLTSPQHHSSVSSDSSSVNSIIITTSKGQNEESILLKESTEGRQLIISRSAFPDLASNSAATTICNALALIPPVYGRTKRSIYHRSTAIQSVTESQLRTTLSMPDLQGSTSSLISSESSLDFTPLGRVRRCFNRGIRHVRRHLRSIIDPSMFESLSFNLFLISTLSLFFWCNVTYFFITIYASTHVGISNRLAAMLLAIMGSSDMVGEVAYGWAADQNWSNILYLYTSGVMLCGLATMLVPLAASFWSLVLYNCKLILCVVYTLITMLQLAVNTLGVRV